MTQVVLIHGNENTAPKLAAALPGARVAVIYQPGSTPAYNEATGLAHDYPQLRQLLAKYAPQWRPGEPLVMMGFSAGAWALRYYLRNPSARSDISAAVFLDGLYGESGGVCDLTPYKGVIAYAQEAQASPSTKRLVMTYSLAHPGPDVCSEAIAAAAGPGAGVYVRKASNGDHSAQQTVMGPQVLKELIAPWVQRNKKSRSVGSTIATVVGVIGVIWLIVRRA